METSNFECELNYSSKEILNIQKMLPAWKTKILEIKTWGKDPKLEIKLQVAATTPQEIRKWVRDYEDLSQYTYSITSSENCSGRYVIFKQRLHCRHNTGCSRTYNPILKNRTRNTNCPSKINITLRAVKKVYRGIHKEQAPNRLMPCEIVLIATHNHNKDELNVLHYRTVSAETKTKLMQLFEHGHTPASALQSLKMDIKLSYENFQQILNDRKYCPDYNYCFRLYSKEFKGKQKASITSSNDCLLNYLNNLSVECRNNVQYYSMDSDYVVIICPPFLERVHENIKEATKIVFTDSIPIIGHKGTRMFLLLTYSDCGGLPLGVIITSSETVDGISRAFKVFQDLLGDKIFGSNLDGPDIFMTDNFDAEQIALKMIWKKSTCLLSMFHVLRTVWKWITKTKTEIKQEDQLNVFEQFQNMMYSTSVHECSKNYEKALNYSKNYPNYCKLLKHYWNRRELWTLCYRSYLLENSIHFSEANVNLIKEKLIQQIKNFNVVQVVDFMLTKFFGYYEKRIINAVHNNTNKIILNELGEFPQKELIAQTLVLNNNIHLVPSEETANLLFIVITDILICTCTKGHVGKICKHIDFICFYLHSEEFLKNIIIIDKQRLFYFVATGTDLPTENQIAIEEKAKQEDINEDSNKIDGNSQQSSNEGSFLIEQISQKFTDLLSKSPRNFVTHLKIINQSLDQLTTTSNFIEDFISGIRKDTDSPQN